MQIPSKLAFQIQMSAAPSHYDDTEASHEIREGKHK